MSAAPAPTEVAPNHSRWWRVACFMLLLSTIVVVSTWLSRPDMGSLMRRARLEFLHGDYEQAIETVEQVLIREPNRMDALVLAGDTSFAMNRFDQALVYYRRVPTGPSAVAVHAQLRCGRIEMHHVGNAVTAESDFRAALRCVPDDPNALFQLASLLGMEARRSEAVPFILRLFRLGRFNTDFLALLEAENGALFNIDELQRYRNTAPDSPGVLVGLAWHARNSGRDKEALEFLSRAKRTDPQFAESRIALADLLWESGRYSELRLLLGEHESTRIDDARFWLIRGQLTEYDGKPEEAARCFWETLLRNPTNRNSTYKLYQYFTAINDEKTAALLQHRLEMLLELRVTSDVVTSQQHTDAEAMRRLVEQLERVGQVWEAWGWCVVARDLDPNAKWAVAKAKALQAILRNASLTLVHRPVDLPCNLSHLPLPIFETTVSGEYTSSTLPDSAVTFQDDAESTGLEFQYFNSPSPPDTGQFMYEFNGGGCGVLDYDADGWPDVYFTQGCRWEARGDQNIHLDLLFRNLGDGRFVDVTNAAGLFEDRFSTGVAIGDFDNDGFADCYVANIGGNRLFHNNGDGTFSVVNQPAGVDDPHWSTSCVMADLNGDSLPDIYSVNYLQGESIFETVCQHDDGRPRMCMPFHFSAAQDQFYINLGDGRFVNATAESGVRVTDGKGLGVVAADWQGDGRLSLFVANDTVPNAFFVNRASQDDDGPIFEERAMPAGIALNHAGRAEGCMGIAVGDVDEDGGLDLFVTNFLRESNTLYRSLPGSFFADTTPDSGLAEPSLSMLGFGTQFLDADLNGQLDLIVANGHIDDYRRYGRPYKMSPQFYHNTGQGQFSVQSGSQTGPYFSQAFLGRSLARWDWNRDGREDAVISNLDHPAALLTNTTRQHGRYLSLRLRGVESSRDAIGATVTLYVGDRRIIRQLTSGDGYQASNERTLIFGLSDFARVKRVDIAWPSRRTESWNNLEADGEYLVIEGVDRAFRLDRIGLTTTAEDRQEK
ncbi:MAG: tetratricopeptide repeat protein [Fuerstiella sp.]|nr:tetratricopeptide repeat protein [Fuerstiella sp.]MCP4512920.1 tetratricopeptide repeat protein [Fuerstiella sp.]